MSRTTLQMTDALIDYVQRVGVRESQVLESLRLETGAMDEARMQISPEQGALMALLVQAIGARRCLEVGVFTGYSSLQVALALPDDGRITACDVSDAWTAVARRYWALAKVEDKIDLRLAPAVETLDALIAEGASDSYDFAFIDADKERYDEYYERCLTLLRPSGLLMIDNVLWSGRVADPQDNDAETVSLRKLNEKLRVDERIHLSLVPVSDGVTLALKR